MSAKVAKLVRKFVKTDYGYDPRQTGYEKQTFHARYSLAGHAESVSDPITLSRYTGRNQLQLSKNLFANLKAKHPQTPNREIIAMMGTM